MYQQPHYYVNTFAILLAITVVVFNTGLLLLHMLAIGYCNWYFYRKQTVTSNQLEEGLPGVSIFKPLVGIDNNIYSNLESFFNLDYPTYELLFCLENDNDMVRSVVDTLMEKYPNVHARIFSHPKRYDVNPKINNIMQGYEVAQYGLVMISDSGIRMRPEALTDMVLRLTSRPDIGMVHQMPFVEQRAGFSNVVHSVYFGGSHAKMYIAANVFGINCTTGMSLLMRKAVLDKLPGGLAYFGRYLAEDFFLAKHFYSEGYKVVLSHYPALQDGKQSIKDLRRRLMRWCKLRAAMIPHIVLLEPISDCLLSGLLGSWACTILFWSINPWVYFLCHCLLWLILDYILVHSCIHQSDTPFSRLTYLCAWLLCTFMSPVNVLCSQLKSEIVWREKRFVLLWGGVTKELTFVNKHVV